MKTNIKFLFVIFLLAFTASCNSDVPSNIPTITEQLQPLATPSFTPTHTSPTASLTNAPYPTRTPNPTEQAWQKTPTITTQPGYPTPAPIENAKNFHVSSKEYIENYVVNYWFNPLNNSPYYQSFYTISSIGHPQDEIEAGLGYWQLKDITNDGNPEIVFAINNGGRCCHGAVAYDVKSETKILDAAQSYCYGQFKDLDEDGILEYIACKRASALSDYCSESGAPITKVVFQYNKNDGIYQPASPKFSYFYNRGLESKNLYLLENGYNDFCAISSTVLDYLYSGRTDKAWELASKYSKNGETGEIKKLAQEEVVESSWYTSPEKFQPSLLATLHAPITDDDTWAWWGNLKYSSNDKMLAINYKHAIYVLDVNSGETTGKLQTNEEYLADFAFDLSDTNIAYVGESGVVNLWNLKTGKTREIYKTKYMSSCLSFMPNGNSLAICAGNEILIIHINSSKVMASYKADDFLCELTINNSGTKFAAIAGINCDNIFLWDIKTRDVIGANLGGSKIFNPTEDTLFTSGYDDNDGTSIEMFDANNGKWLSTVTSKQGDIAISPDGNTLICYDGNKIYFIDVQSHDILYTLVDDDIPINDIVLSHNGKLLASLKQDGSIKLWDIP